MSDVDNSKGNGCLYLIGVLGVVLVLAGLAWEKLPSFAEGLFDDPDPPPARGLGFGPEPTPAEPQVVEPPPPPLPAEPPSPEPADLTPIVWVAEVITHHDLEEGTPCAMTLEIERRLDGPVARTALIVCGGRVLFEGPVGTHDLSELNLRDRGFGYRASARSMGGPGFERIALTFASDQRRLTLTQPGQTSELFVDDLSVPRRGEPFIADSALNGAHAWAPVRRRALVRGLTGEVPAVLRRAREGNADCSLSVRPAIAGGDLNCRILLRCGGAAIYGAAESGYNRCVVEMGQVASARDEGFSTADTDPDLDLDLGEGRLVVSDVGADGIWSATLRLDEPETCSDPIDLYSGSAFGEEREPASLTRQDGAWDLTLGALQHSAQVGLESCRTGFVRVTSDAGSADVALSFDGRSWLGVWMPTDGTAPSVLALDPG